MAVFRVEKTKNYTVMSNYHLRDPTLSCKACGLLSKMLSLPENWDYTTRGLAAICKDGVGSIGSALKELEAAGYLVRRQLRDDHGRMSNIEYTIYETPQLAKAAVAPPHTSLPDTENPYTVNPRTESPDTGPPCPEFCAQLNTDLSNIQEINTEIQITDSFFPSASQTLMERQKAREQVLYQIRERIEYDVIANTSNRKQLDELVEIMVEVELNQSDRIRISRRAEFDTAYVRDRLRMLGRDHIECVLDAIDQNSTQVKNTKSYLLAALFNASATTDNHYTMQVNHDLYGSP